MSYSCSASFKKIPNDIDVLEDFFSQLKEYASKEEIANEIVEYYKYLCPITETNSLKMKRGDAYDLPELESWITELFTFKWKLLRYENETLLCMLGVPVQLQKIFDCTIYFQNSTDQDYEREEWVIDTFTRIYDKWQSKPIDEVVDYYAYITIIADHILSGEDIEDNYSYYRRCAAYQEIASPVENLLYDDKTSTYIQLFNSYNDISILRMYKLICVPLPGLQFKESQGGKEMNSIDFDKLKASLNEDIKLEDQMLIIPRSVADAYYFKLQSMAMKDAMKDAIPIAWIEMFMKKHWHIGDSEHKALNFMVTEWKKWEKENEIN